MGHYKTEELSNRRKADRQKLAEFLMQELEHEDVSIELTDLSQKVYVDGSRSSQTRRLEVVVRFKDLVSCRVAFDGDSSQPDTYVCTWNTATGVYIDPRKGHVNPYHFGKMTRVAHNIRSLVYTLKTDIESFRDGSGFLAEDSPELANMRKRYEEAGWAWIYAA